MLSQISLCAESPMFDTHSLQTFQCFYGTHQKNFHMDSQPNVEAKLHDESTMIQRCFDDNNDDNKR